jgi:hypothetical protein
MFVKEMKPIIIKAMSMDLKNIQTCKGYDGANILKLSFSDESAMIAIRDFTRKNGYDTNNDYKNHLDLFCIFESPTEIYALK